MSQPGIGQALFAKRFGAVPSYLRQRSADGVSEQSLIPLLEACDSGDSVISVTRSDRSEVRANAKIQE
jgi:hypothetical protein